MNVRLYGMCAPLALTILACGLGTDDPDMGPDAGVSAPSGGACGDRAAMPCDDLCGFEPADVDCARACQNIAEKCASGECDTHCTSVNQDVSTCTAACEGTKQLSCTNETFGCWASEDTCDGVGRCFQEVTGEGGTGPNDDGADEDDADDDTDEPSDDPEASEAGRLQASGSYNGMSFSMSCDLTNCSLRGDGDPCTLQCQRYQWFATCRPPSGELQLWFYLPADQGTAGEHDFVAAGANGVQIGGPSPLQANSDNAVENTITITRGGSTGEPIAGSFRAEWSDDGDEHGEVSGTFDFPCN